MSDKTLKIGEVTEETIEAIKKRSAFALPDNPSASGMKATEIKKAFWAPIISQFGSLFTELARVIKEANASLDALDEEDKRIAEDLLEKLSLAQSNFQTALEGHDLSAGAHEDIREWLKRVEALTETIKTWQNEGSDLPPAFSLVKSFYEKFLDEMNKLSPMASGSINNIKYDADAGDLILYFNNGTSVKVELPLERLVGEGYYDEESRTIRLSLDGGDELVIPVGDLVDEYEGDGETVEVYREGGVRKIRILPALKEKINMAHTHQNKDVLDTFTEELKESYDDAVEKARAAYSASLAAGGIYSNAAIGTLTGRAARADDVSPLPHKLNISIKGESVQEGTPTPETPVDVVNCENPTLKIFRKNLLKNPDSVTRGMSGGVTVTAKTDGSLTLNGTIDESQLSNAFQLYKDDTTPLITLRAGVTYKIRLLDEDGNVFSNQFSTRVVDGNGYDVLFTNGNSSYTPTIDKPIYRIFLYAYAQAVGTTYENKIVYPILEVVGEGDEYDEYNEQSVTIPLTLAGQGDYKDEIVVDRNTNTVKHIQRYCKYEFTGEETWSILSSSYSVDTTLATFRLSTGVSTFSAASDVNYELCNAFPCVMNYSQDTVGVYATTPTGERGFRIYARIPTVDATSADFNEVFESGTYLWYPMAEPIETDYSHTEWGQALLALVSEGETLTFDCDAETSISYNKDINKVIQKLTDAIIALGGTI